MPTDSSRPVKVRELTEVLREQTISGGDGRRSLREGEDLSSVNALQRRIQSQAASGKDAGQKK